MGFRERMLQLLRFAPLGVVLAMLGCGSTNLNRRVLVVYAANSPDSLAVAKYYAKVRYIPAANLCPIHLRNTDATLLRGEEYEQNVKSPVEECLKSAGPDKILYIVLAYVRPFRIDPGGLHDYALDSYLADIWDFYSTRPIDPAPGKLHPYYANHHAREEIFLPFLSLADFRAQQDSAMIYSVWRLDGPTPAIARSLVDKAVKIEAAHGPSGQACIDEQVDPMGSPDQGYRAADWDLHRAAEMLASAGFKVLEDTRSTEFGTPPSETCPDTALYAGWYKYGHYNDAFSWNDGAIGFHLDSGSMLDAREGESWSVNALKRGITVTSGAESEPFLAALPRPSGVFHDLLAGANVGDAFLRNTRFLKWRIVNIGDPLYTPFPGGRKNIGPRMHTNAHE
jgi:uncharacterized protein (TIGR03790 family)